jgi:periplasmic divalent cation tolerance protein
MASTAVREGLAACVHIEGPLTSRYMWAGELVEAEEWRASFKTTQAGWVKLRDWIIAQHSYELPEIIALPVTASAAYASWATANVKTNSPN